MRWKVLDNQELNFHHTLPPTSYYKEKGEDIVCAISNNGVTCVRQFGLLSTVSVKS